MKKILVIDDETDICEILNTFLKEEGYKVMIANNYREAMEKINENPDLVLLDIAMPDKNGIEVLKDIKQKNKNIPVIMITAYRDAEKVVQAFRIGAYDCIFKPFDFKYLRTSILASIGVS